MPQTIRACAAALTLAWGTAQAETATPTAPPELPQALFILPWQPQGKVPEARKHWLDKLPPGHVRTVDKQELNRQINYYAILGHTASAAERDRGAQED